MPGPAIILILLENGIEMHEAQVSDKTVKNRACGAQVEAQFDQKLVKSVPGSPHRASKRFQMEPWAVELVHFSAVLDDSGPLSLNIAPGMQLSLENDPSRLC